MKKGFKKLKIILETTKDRGTSKLDRVIHKPFNSRMLLSSPIEFISKLRDQDNMDESEELVIL